LGDALVFTLAQILGEDFTPEIRAAWVTAYEEVSSVMLRGIEGDAAFGHLAAGFH
jgi:hemoglobin-like flavoprotein